jgi:hypothetical protein
MFRVALASNYIALKCRNQGVYQYAVSFSPEVDSLFMRHRLIEESSDVLGPTKSFDGRILFLPIKLNQVCYMFDLLNLIEPEVHVMHAMMGCTCAHKHSNFICCLSNIRSEWQSFNEN